MNTNSREPLRLAYLNTRFPAISHTFIEGEIRALRALGAEIQPFSVRPPHPADLLDTLNQNAAKETIYLYKNLWNLLWPAAFSIVQNPGGFLRALVESQKQAAPGLFTRFRYVAYALQAGTLARKMGKRRLTHVHIHMANNGATVGRLARAWDPKISYSLTVHGPAEFLEPEVHSLAGRVNEALFVRCISEFCRSQVLKFASADKKKHLHVVHCGIDVQKFMPRAGAASSRNFGLLSVGRLVPEKGFLQLIEACAQLKDRLPELNLRIVGDGPLRPQLEAKIKALSLEAKVELCGYRRPDEIQVLLQEHRAFVLASFAEGVPMVLMEAMASGCEVISTPIAGIPELISDGQNGHLVPPGSPRELAEKIFFILNDSSAPEIREQARRTVSEKFSISRNAEKLKKLFLLYL